MKITGGFLATAGWALADLINAFRDEEQQAQYARNKAVAGKIASTGMAIGGKLNPEKKAGTGTHSKTTPSQHAGEGTQGVQPPSNPSNIHGAATTTVNQGAAHKARLEGLKANQAALQQQNQALPIQATAAAGSQKNETGQKPQTPMTQQQQLKIIQDESTRWWNPKGVGGSIKVPSSQESMAGLRPDGTKGPNKVGDTNKGLDGKEYILKPREGYGYNQWVPKIEFL